MKRVGEEGGQPFTMLSIHTSPAFEDLWQMHFSLLSGQEYTTPGMFIANGLDDASPTMPVAPPPPQHAMLDCDED